MAKYCTTCGKPLREGDKFCIGCGTPVAGAGQRGSEQPFAVPSANSPAPSASAVSWGQPSQAGESQYQPSAAFDEDTESDIAATEVWEVPVEKSPNHADPFVVEVPKVEADMEAEKKSAVDFSAKSDPVGKSGFSGKSDSVEKSDTAEKNDFAMQEPAAFATEAPAPKDSGNAAPQVDPVVSAIGDNAALDDDGDEEDEYDESPTIVAQFLGGDDEDEEDESPTIVVARERYVLVQDEDGQRTELIPPCILGRGKAADKRLQGNLAVSRKHAKVFKEDGKLLIQDLGSTNGTFIDGEELDGDQCVPLEDGMSVRLGTEDFSFHVEQR